MVATVLVAVEEEEEKILWIGLDWFLDHTTVREEKVIKDKERERDKK